MAIVVEDGTRPAGANSYVTVADARIYADARGLVLDVDDAVVEKQLLLATDWLERLGYSYIGYKFTQDQELQWPRYKATLYGFPLTSSDIPNELVVAQILLAVELSANVDLTPTSTGRFKIRTKVDVLETWYSDTINTTGLPNMPAVQDTLAPLLRNQGLLRTVRA